MQDKNVFQIKNLPLKILGFRHKFSKFTKLAKNTSK